MGLACRIQAGALPLLLVGLPVRPLFLHPKVVGGFLVFVGLSRSSWCVPLAWNLQAPRRLTGRGAGLVCVVDLVPVWA